MKEVCEKQWPFMARILTHGVRRVRDNHIKGFLILFHELKTISHMQGQLSTGIPHCHPWEVLFRYLDHVLQHREHNWVRGGLQAAASETTVQL